MEPPPPPAGDGNWDKALRNLMKNKDLLKTAPKGREGVEGREGLDNELDATPASDEQFDSELRKLLRDSQANLTTSPKEGFMTGKETDEPLPEVVDPSFDWYAEWRTFQKDHAAPASDPDPDSSSAHPTAASAARSELASVTFGSDSDSDAASVVPPVMELASVVPGGAPYAQKQKSTKGKAAVAKASPVSAALAVAVALFSRFSALFRVVLSWLAGRFGVAVATNSTHPEMDPAANAALSSAGKKAKRANRLRAPDDINAAWNDFSKRQQKVRDEPTDD